MTVTFEKHWRCDTCGEWVPWSETRKQGGYRVCLDCYDEPGVDITYIPPPTAKWDDFSVRKCEDEYGIPVWIEEFGGACNASGEYGVLTYMEGFNPLSSISGEYGTLVFMPDYMVNDPAMVR